MSLCFDQQDTFLYVKDLEKSERFYGEILGLELVLNQGLAQVAVSRVVGESGSPGLPPGPKQHKRENSREPLCRN
jgi:catechol 2,3-dioxygenase-like lactoylglutathione lyase family enzyme